MINATQIPADVSVNINTILKSFGLRNALLPQTSEELVKEILGKDKTELWNIRNYGPTFTVDDDLDFMSKQEKKRLLKSIKKAKLYYGYVEDDVAYEVIVVHEEVRVGIPLSPNEELMNKIYEFLNG